MNFLCVFLITSLVCFSATFASSIVKRDLRHDIIVYAEGVIRTVTDEISKLKAQGRTAEATILQNEERILQNLVVQLETAHGEAHFRRLESEIMAIETRIQEQIRRDERITARPTTPEPTTQRPTSPNPTTQRPTSPNPTTQPPTTTKPTTQRPTSPNPTTQRPTSPNPTTQPPTTTKPTTQRLTTPEPKTQRPTSPNTNSPKPTTRNPTGSTTK